MTANGADPMRGGTEPREAAPLVAAETPVVFCAIPRDGIGNRVGLGQFAARRRVAQSSEAGETQSRQSEVKRVGRNSRDPGVSRDVFNSGIQVGRRNVDVAVVKAQISVEPARRV